MRDIVTDETLRATSLHVSVPEHEAATARRFLGDAPVTPRPPSALADESHEGVRVLSVSSQDLLDLEALEALPSLEAVVTRSTGCDRLPLLDLERRGVRAYHLDGYATESVAEYTLLCLLMLLRRIPEAITRTRGWSERGRVVPRWDRSGLCGGSLKDVTVGVLGTGRIGGRVVRLLSGLGVRTIGYDIAPDEGLVAVSGFRYADSLAHLLESSHALTLHVPLTPSTQHLVDADALARLPAHAVLVNTARGAVVDQAAVATALRAGRLAGYAADVLPDEPEPGDMARFVDEERAVVTPHLAAYDERAVRARYETTAFVVDAVLAGDQAALEAHRAEAAPEAGWG